MASTAEEEKKNFSRNHGKIEVTLRASLVPSEGIWMVFQYSCEIYKGELLTR